MERQIRGPIVSWWMLGLTADLPGRLHLLSTCKSWEEGADRGRGAHRLPNVQLLVHAVGVVVLEVADELIATGCQGESDPADRTGDDALTRATSA